MQFEDVVKIINERYNLGGLEPDAEGRYICTYDDKNDLELSVDSDGLLVVSGVLDVYNNNNPLTEAKLRDILSVNMGFLHLLEGSVTYNDSNKTIFLYQKIDLNGLSEQKLVDSLEYFVSILGLMFRQIKGESGGDVRVYSPHSLMP